METGQLLQFAKGKTISNISMWESSSLQDSYIITFTDGNRLIISAKIIQSEYPTMEATWLPSEKESE